MLVCGFEKFSLVDYDGKISCTIFTKGCNFHCPFCHNSPLVEKEKYNEIIDESKIFEYLTKRKNVVDAVCISGGEPTLQPDLIDFVKKVKSLGFLVKLDTNGYHPEILEKLLKQKLIDYVAMDIKNCKAKYSYTADSNIDITKIEKSVSLLKNSNIDYEFRTTIISEFHTKNDIIEISKWLDGSKNYVLQKYKDDDDCIEHGFNEVDKQIINEYIEILKTKIKKVSTRGY